MDAEENFKLVKSTIDSIIERHGVKKHLYSLMTFGQRSNIVFPFQKTDKESLLTLIQGARLPSGSPDLVNALKDVKYLFFQPSGGARPDSRKVIIVMIDRKSVNTGSNIEKIVGDFEDGKVRFVTVIIGKNAGQDELIPLAPDKDKTNIVYTDKDGVPSIVGKKIMVLITLGKYYRDIEFVHSV